MSRRIPHGHNPTEVRQALQRLEDTFFDDSSDVDHDETTNFVAAEHVDHSGVSILAGTGLTGGGTIEANRTISLSHLGLEALADPGADRIFFWDESANATKWLIIGAGLQIVDTTISAVAGGIDHGGLTGLSDDDHTQYLLANGTRALSGDLSVNAAITIDGRDISADGAKLDTIETNADVTDATNVAAAGAAMAGGAFHDGFSDFVAAEHLSLPNTIANVLSDHNLAAHTALGLFDQSSDVDHDATTNYVAAEHVSLPNTIANVLTDHDLSAHTALGLFDQSSDVDHDATTNFVANEHIDHSGVSISAGTGLTGGGDLTATRTLSVDESAVDHGGLGGLTDDDHSQYLLADGTRGLSGDWTTGAYSIIGSDHWYLRADSVYQYYGEGNDATIGYDGNHLQINPRAVGAGQVQINGEVKITLGATDFGGIEIDGTTNDLTDNSSNPAIMKIYRDINYGTGELLNATVFDYKIYQKHSAATLAGSVEFYSISNEVQNDGTVVNDTVSNYRLYQGAIVNLIDDNGTYDSQSTGTLQGWNWASRNYVDNDCVFSDTGGNNPANALIVRCITAETNVNPTLSSGSLTVTNVGLWIQLVGTTVGNSTAYGIYINAVTGHDANYGIWDASGCDWILDGDNQKIRLGETQGDFDLYSDGTDATIDATADIYLNAGATVKLGATLDMNNNNLTNPGTGHDAFTDFAANEHVDHSGVSISAGTGLTGGGDITATRTLSLSHLGLESLADPGADRIAFWDESNNAFKWLTLGTNLSITDDTINAAGGSCDYGNLYSNPGSVWSLSSTAWTQVPYTNAGQESGANARAGADDDIVIATDGVYLITCTMSMRTVNSANVGTLFLQIKKNNGATDLLSCASSSHFNDVATRKVVTAVGLEALEENDTIEAWCQTDNATARNFYVEHFSLSVVQIA